MSVTAVINGHREGAMLAMAIKSALSAKANSNALIDIHVVLDRPDEVTRAIANTYRDTCMVSEVDFADLGASRNFGVEGSNSKYIAFLDGDDLWSFNWLSKAHEISDSTEANIVLHPEINVYFNNGHPKQLGAITRHIASSSQEFNLSVLAQANYWTALSFAPRELYLRFPFRRVSVGLGNGFEDWAFNLETSTAGIDHAIAPETAHFIRDKNVGSMRREHSKRKAIFYPVSLRN